MWALAIVTHIDGFIGSCGTFPVEGAIFESYYSLIGKHWGSGYATEAARAFLDYLFRNTGVTETLKISPFASLRPPPANQNHL